MRKILIPTDFSSHARNAIKYGIKLAAVFNAKLIFFHCTNISVTRELLGISKQEMKKRMDDDVKKKTLMLNQEITEVHDLLHQKCQDTHTKAIVKNGILVPEEIIDTAKKNKADLIVTGTHGVSGLNKIFGSNTSSLISKSDIPVMAIPKNYRYKTIHKITYASDFKNILPELKAITRFAQAYEATIDIFNLCYNEIPAPEGFFRNLSTRVNYPRLRLLQIKGDPEKTVLQQLKDYINQQGPDLLVMFPAERSILEKVFSGSKTERLSYDLKMPLLSIKKK